MSSRESTDRPIGKPAFRDLPIDTCLLDRLHYRNTAFDTAFQKPFYAEGSKAFVFPMALPECREGPKTNDLGTESTLPIGLLGSIG